MPEPMLRQGPPAGLLAFGVVLAVLLPWLNPFAGGPSPVVTPTLLAALCCAALVLLLQPAWSGGRVAAFLVMLGLAIGLAAPGFGGELLASWLGLLMVLLSAAAATAIRRDPRLLQALVWAWLLAAVLSAVLGVLQITGWADGLQPWVSRSDDGIPFGNLRQRNQLATLCNMGLASLACLLAMDAGSSAARPVGPRPAGRSLALHACWIVPLLTVVLALTTSRTGAVQLLVLALLAWRWRRSLPPAARRAVWLALPAYGLGVLVSMVQESGMASNMLARAAIQESGCGSRKLLWANVLDLIGQRPWTGWGWRELAWAHYQGHFENRFCLILDNAHNLPLHLAVELGVPVAVLACVALAWGVWRGQPWRAAEPQAQLAWTVLVLVAIHSLVEYPLWYGPFQMAVGLAVGLLVPIAGHPSHARWRAAWSGTALALLPVVLWAAQDYWRVGQMYLSSEQRAPAWRGDTLRKIGGSLLFDNQLRFAELSVTPLTATNALQMQALARRLMHYSPEPRVIETLLDSSLLLGQEQAARAEAERYRAAFPADHASWSRRREALSGGGR